MIWALVKEIRTCDEKRKSTEIDGELTGIVLVVGDIETTLAVLRP